VLINPNHVNHTTPLIPYLLIFLFCPSPQISLYTYMLLYSWGLCVRLVVSILLLAVPSSLLFKTVFLSFLVSLAQQGAIFLFLFQIVYDSCSTVLIFSLFLRRFFYERFNRRVNGKGDWSAWVHVCTFTTS
jgi:hypothetical protein